MYVQVIGRPLRFVCGKQLLIGGETLYMADVTFEGIQIAVSDTKHVPDQVSFVRVRCVTSVNDYRLISF